MTNSLFSERHSHENKHQCQDCVCQLLDDLANQPSDFCSAGNQEQLLIILKGASEPLTILSLDATIFKLIKFDPKTGCAVFTFQTGRGANVRTRTIVINCSCICSVVCLGTQDIQPY